MVNTKLAAYLKLLQKHAEDQYQTIERLEREKTEAFELGFKLGQKYNNK